MKAIINPVLVTPSASMAVGCPVIPTFASAVVRRASSLVIPVKAGIQSGLPAAAAQGRSLRLRPRDNADMIKMAGVM